MRCMLLVLACTRRFPKKKSRLGNQGGCFTFIGRLFVRSNRSAHRTLSRSEHRGVSTPVAGLVTESLLMLERLYITSQKFGKHSASVKLRRISSFDCLTSQSHTEDNFRHSGLSDD